AVQLGRIPQTLSDGAAQLLETYPWPGNIRELQNLLERMAVLCESQIIEESDLPLEFVVAASLKREAERETSLQAAMAAFERGFLKKTLAQNGWNRRRAAEHLGIGYSTLNFSVATPFCWETWIATSPPGGDASIAFVSRFNAARSSK